MSNTVTGKAFKVNEQDYFKCPKDVAINCENATSQGTEWFVPTVSGGIHTGYSKRRGSTKPTPDSVKTVRVKDNLSGSIYWLLIADDATEAVYTDICGGCCDDDNALPAVTVPTVLLEEDGCVAEEGDDYVYFDIAQDLGDDQQYSAEGSKNGTAFTPAAPTTPGGGFGSLGAFVTWANTNWAAFGTFANPSGNKVTFTSSDAVTGYIKINTIAAS